MSMDERLGYLFWKNLDACKGSVSLTDLSKKLSLNYRGILDQRTSNRLPRLEDAYAMASCLGVSLEFLLTGKQHSLASPEAQAVEEDKELRLVVRALMENRHLLSTLAAAIESGRRLGENPAL